MMKLLFALLILSACSGKDVPEVKKQVELVNSEYSVKLTRYSLPVENCVVTWEANRTPDKALRNISIQYRAPYPCTKSFEELRPAHQRILKTLFLDHPADHIKGMHTGGLASLQPNGSWNKVIAEAATKSEDYLDFRKNYPKHASKKSSNDILVDLLHQERPYAPFTNLLADFGFQVEVEGVEKVFNSKDPTDGKTVIDDAGSIWWSRRN